MIRVSVLYPNEPEGQFDHTYYSGSHRDLVLNRLGPMGLIRVEVDRGLAGMGEAPAPYVACGYMYFDSVDDFQAAMAAHGDEVIGDVPNFTNIEPVLQVCEMAAA